MPPADHPDLHELPRLSEAMRAFLERLRAAAKSDVTVLISGESGTGKGLMTRVLHESSARAAAPLVWVGFAEIAPTLVESTLFGHERGAFTDAKESRRGLVRAAEGGTLVLDDVDLMPAALQKKLLRLLQERSVLPLGAEQPIQVDVRVVATSARDLAQLVRSGAFREDLYYRLAVVVLEVPPLRARREDLPLLARSLGARAAARLRVPAREISPAALERLMAHPWPGNVRELENALERALVLGAKENTAADPIRAEELDFLCESIDGVADELARRALAHGLSIEGLTRAMLERALVESRGNVSAAARSVGLTRRAFDYRTARPQGEEEA